MGYTGNIFANGYYYVPSPSSTQSTLTGVVRTQPLKYVSATHATVSGIGPHYIDNNDILVSVEALSNVELIDRLILMERWGWSADPNSKDCAKKIMIKMYRTSVDGRKHNMYRGYNLLLDECQKRGVLPPRFADIVEVR